MSEFNDENILVDTSLQGNFKELLEERNELAKLSHLRELMLEELPNFMRLLIVGLLWAKQYDVLHCLIKLLI